MTIVSATPVRLTRKIGASAGTPGELVEIFRPLKMITLKLTPGCNLSCTYCNVDAASPSTPRMSIETYRRIVDLLVDNSVHDTLTLEFHGGEPLLLGQDWFREAVGYARQRAAETGRTIHHPVATNGTMLTEARLAMIEELGLLVRVSIDGPPDINDRRRGGGKAVAAGIERLLDRGMDTTARVVISPDNAHEMDRVVEFLAELGVREFAINFLQPQGRGVDDDQLSADDMTHAMTTICEHMVTHGVFENAGLRYVLRHVAGRDRPAKLSCWENQCQAGRTFVGIDHLGDIHACPTDVEHHVIGNIWSAPDLRHRQRVLDRLHIKDAWFARCRGCEAAEICDQSCPTSDFNSDLFREVSCAFTKQFHGWLVDNPDRVSAICEAAVEAGHFVRS